MCIGGIPRISNTHQVEACLAALGDSIFHESNERSKRKNEKNLLGVTPWYPQGL